MTTLEPACDMVLLVQAEFDGELDAAQAARLAAHRGQCAVCRAAAEQLTRARALLQAAPYEPAPEDLRRRLRARLDAAAPRKPWRGWRAWRSGGLGFALGAACAAALALLLIAPQQQQTLTQQILASHIRALQPGHLEDVVSTDRHTVKPWFDGRLDFAPPVKDLAAAGYPLQGGRLDYVGGRSVAALVYRRDRHLIDLYVWPGGDGDAAPRGGARDGYNYLYWRAHGMVLWAVSDVEADQLRGFAAAWQRAP